MRKTLSIILSVVMILSACCFALPVSAAPEGTPINTADEFMAMAADGTYYLNADITLAATYEAPFSGTLDGNGKTVTISAPMFAEFNGTAKNLTINGAITSDGDAGSLAVTSTAGMIVENVTSNVNITITGEGKHAGGIFATNYGVDITSEYTNVVNNGDIYVDSAADEKQRAGGIGGIIENVIFTNCVNTGDIYAKGNLVIVGGMVGRGALHVGINTVEAYYCVNTGNLTADETYTTSGGSDVGGMFGYLGSSGNLGFYRAWGCLNTGDLAAPYRVGGICGYVYGQATQFLDIEFCVSTGDITYGRTASNAASVYDYVSYFIAYTNTTSTVICYNIGMGDIKRVDGALSTNPTAFFGCSSADATLYTISDNYIIDNGAFTHYSCAAADYPQNIIEFTYATENGCATRTTVEELKSGKICVALNNAGQGGEDQKYWFYQTLGTDDIPTVSTDSKWVLDNNGTYVNGDKPVVVETTTEAPKETEAPVTEAPVTENPVTEAPATEAPTTEAPATEAPTTEAPTTEAPKAEGGCGGFVAMGIVACMIPAAVVICSKKKED